MSISVEYGAMLTRKFYEIFPDVDTFLTEWNNTYYKTDLDSDSILPEKAVKLVYYTLCSKYYQSTTASVSEDLFKDRLFTLVYQHSPEYWKRIQIKNELLKLDLNETEISSKTINNLALNPNTEPTTSSDEEINYINQQNVSIIKQNKVRAYREYLDLIKMDYTDVFLNKFSNLFLKILVPQENAIFITGEEEEDGSD